MAMSKESMASKVIAKLEAINPGTDNPIYLLYWRAIAEGIIEEITENMDITTTVNVPGVQSGSSTVTGTGQDTVIE